MKLTGLPLSDLVVAFRSTNPTPGGGSAAALAGAVGAALLSMVAAMPKNRAANDDDAGRLQSAATRGRALSDALLDLVDRDSDAYEAVVTAYRMPKASDEEKTARKAAIQAAMKQAAEAPLDTMRRAAEALEAAPAVARLGHTNAASDVVVAVELLLAAVHGARANVEINLASLDDAAYVAEVGEEVARIEQRSTGAASASRRKDA